MQMKKRYNTIAALFILLYIIASTQLVGQNLVQNPSFETGMLSPWTAGNNNTVNIIEDAQHGTYAAQGNVEQLIDLVDGVKYTVTCYAKNLTPDINVWVGIRDLVNDEFVANYLITSTEYEKATIEFTSKGTGQHRFWAWGQAGSDYISDNWVLLADGTTSVNDVFSESSMVKITSSRNGVEVAIDDNLRWARISIFDLAGNRIYNHKAANGIHIVNNHAFNVPGIYIVSVQTDQGMKSSKVYVNPL